MFPLCPFLPMVHWDEIDRGNSGMWSGTGWDLPISSFLPMSHWDDMDRGNSEGIQACGVVQVGMFPLCPFLCMVHVHGMHSGNLGMGSGTGWGVPTSSLPFHGPLGWDGQWEFRHVTWYRLGWDGQQVFRYVEWYRVGCSHFVPSFLW